MNNKPRHVRPVVHGARPQHAHHVGHGHNHHRHPNGDIARPRPPSQSQAPWNVTQWIDPIQTNKSSKLK